MEHYKFTEADKFLIAEDDGKSIMFHCATHGVYLKYKKSTSSTCPWCDKSNDPIQGVRELRKKFRKELNIE